MMKRSIEWCLDNTTVVIMLAALVGGAGIWAVRTIPVDAFPDISENQIIVSAQWSGRSPEDMQDQVTFPLTVELQGIPEVDQIRGLSGFGFSRIYVVFGDGVDFYWARTRVLERLEGLADLLPDGVRPELGPDATPLGQIYWYTVDGPYDLGTLRTIQDYTVRYALQSVSGVSEVSSIGGHVIEYRVEVDPDLLYSTDIDISEVRAAIAASNIDVGASTVESSGMEYVVRGRGLIEDIGDLETIPVVVRNGVPVTLSELALISTGPAFRRGALADETGEVAGGIVVMRKDANPVEVIEAVEERLAEIAPALPEGVEIRPYYDRRELVLETTGTLSNAIVIEMLVTLLVILIFLLHLRSSMIVTSILPYSVLLAFIGMRLLGISANIMSFAGIAIAIGTLVDMGIVVTENIHLSLSAPSGGTPKQRITSAVSEVAPAILTSLGTTVISFIPVFFLTGQSGRLFIPLAWTKTLVLGGAGLVALTLIPVLALRFIVPSPATRKRARMLAGVLGASALAAWAAWSLGSPDWLPLKRWLFSSLVFAGAGFLFMRIAGEKFETSRQEKLTKHLTSIYEPLLRWCISHRKVFLSIPLIIILLGLLSLAGAGTVLQPLDSLGLDTERFRPTAVLYDLFPGIGTEFMPPLDEGSLLFMPSLLNQASLGETVEAMLAQNRAMAAVPEVEMVVGKAGRADSPLDPAPVGMIETVINLLPRDEWRDGVTSADILAELREVTDMPGIAPSWLQPIETRIVMLQSGIRTSIGCEIHGSDYLEIERIALALEEILSTIPGADDVSALRTGRRPYLEISVDRDAAARYGVSVGHIQSTISAAIGGVEATEVISGRERTAVRLSYARDFRNELADLERISVRTMTGDLIPVSLVADIETVTGPAMIRSVNGELVGYVMLSAEGRDEGGLVEEADELIREAILAETKLDQADRSIDLPEGYYFRWVGSYQNQIEAKRRFMILIPVCLLLIFGLMYLQFRTIAVPLIIFLGAVPLAVAGGSLFMQVWPSLQNLLHGLGIMAIPSEGPIYLTVAVAVGFIALLGICVDDGVLMATYIGQMRKKRKPATRTELRNLIVLAGVRRIRPAVMTTLTTIIALLPVILASGRGSELSRPMALPVFGGMLIEFMTMLIVPVVYGWWLERGIDDS